MAILLALSTIVTMAWSFRPTIRALTALTDLQERQVVTTDQQYAGCLATAAPSSRGRRLPRTSPTPSAPTPRSSMARFAVSSPDYLARLNVSGSDRGPCVQVPAISPPLSSPSNPPLTIEMVSFRRAPSSAMAVTGISKLF